MKTRTIIPVLVLMAVIVAIVVFVLLGRKDGQTEAEKNNFIPNVENQNPVKEDEPPIIGGDKDEHGCLAPAGYAYDEQVGACLRSWEIAEDQRPAVIAAVDYLGKDTKVTVTGVEKETCDNCYLVFLQRDGASRVKVVVRNGNVIDVYPVEFVTPVASQSANQ